VAYDGALVDAAGDGGDGQDFGHRLALSSKQSALLLKTRFNFCHFNAASVPAHSANDFQLMVGSLISSSIPATAHDGRFR
jgi:hypothetical protein